MNKELISELRKQAKVDPKEIVKALADTNDSKVVEHWLEQFAEVIVRECKSVMLDMINEGQGDFDTLDQALTEINDHFGVEE